MSQINGLAMEDDPDAALRQSIGCTGGRIGANFESLSTRESGLRDRIRRITRQIEEYQRREPQLTSYAAKIKDAKDKLDIEQRKHRESVEHLETHLTTQITELTMTIHQLSKRSSTTSMSMDKSRMAKSMITRRIEELSCAEEDFRAEASAIGARIQYFMDSVVDDNIPRQEIDVLSKSIMGVTGEHDLTLANLEECEDQKALVCADVNRARLDIERLHSRKVTKLHGFNIEKESLQRKTLRARKEEKHEKKAKVENERVREYLVGVIARHKEEIVKIKRDLENVRSLSQSIHTTIEERSVDIKMTSDDFIEVTEATETVKRNETPLQIEKRREILLTKEERIATQRKVGEVKLQRKMAQRAAVGAVNAIKTLDRRLEKAAKVAELVDRGEKCLIRRIPDDNNELLDSLTKELAKLHGYIALSMKYGASLDSHVYSNVTVTRTAMFGNGDRDNNKIVAKLRKSVKKVRAVNHSLEQRIESLMQCRLSAATKSTSCCPLFAHTTCPNEICDTASHVHNLELRITEKQESIARRRLDISIRRTSLTQVSDFWTDQHHYLEGECLRFCHCKCSHSTKHGSLSHAHLLSRIREELAVWKVAAFSPATLLRTWNNRIEHVIDSTRKKLHT